MGVEHGETARSVSVVLPTTGRRRSLLDSIRSALVEPETAEVLVVYNGGAGDPDLLARCADEPRVRLLEPSGVHGCGPARQVGIEAATAPWVAFLDDDDLWLPGKLERQLAATTSGIRLVTSRSLWRLADRDKVLPQRRPRDGESLSDFTFVVGTGARHGLMSPPTLLVAASLLEEVPWWPTGTDLALDRHEDMQWVARVSPFLAPHAWVLLDSVDAIVTRTSADSMVAGAQRDRAHIAAREREWLEILTSGPHAATLSPAALRSFRLTHIWPYVAQPPRAAVADAAQAPWAAVVGAWRRRSRRAVQTES